MKVLLSTDTVGGVWRYTVDLAHALRHRADLVVATLGTPPDAAQLAELAGVPVVALDQPLDWLATEPHALAQAGCVLADIASAERCDVRLVHAPALVQPGVPAVSVLHSDVATWWDAVHGGALPAELAWRAAATWAGCRRSEAVIAVSTPYADAVRAHYPGPLRVVPNGVPPRPAAVGPRMRAVLCAGRLWDPAKGADVLDAAAACMRHPVTLAGALVAGPGRLRTLHHARYAGVLSPDGLRIAMAHAAVYASAARYEPFGLGVAEAAQSGMALVLSDIPTHRALWDGAAEFVSGADPARWAATLDALLDDPAWTAALSRAAAERATRYTVSASASATFDLLRVAARAYA